GHRGGGRGAGGEGVCAGVAGADLDHLALLLGGLDLHRGGAVGGEGGRAGHLLGAGEVHRDGALRDQGGRGAGDGHLDGELLALADRCLGGHRGGGRRRVDRVDQGRDGRGGGVLVAEELCGQRVLTDGEVGG